MSDMHGRRNNFEKALEAQPDVINVIFLGDGAEDAEKISRFYPERRFYIVGGNCDSGFFPYAKCIEISGKKIFITHGHTFGVKGGTEKLLKAAEQNNVSIAFYGHTHNARVEYCNGIYLVNPGCLCGGREAAGYAVADITDTGIFPNIIKFK